MHRKALIRRNLIRIVFLILLSNIMLQSNSLAADIDVALAANGGIATASSVGSYMGYVGSADKAIDGLRLDTAWDGTSIPAWHKVQFNGLYRINHIGIGWASHVHTFSVSLSSDGSSWTVVIPSRVSTNTEGGPGVYESYNITPTYARYIRINITSTSAPGSHIFQASVSSIEAYYDSTSDSELLVGLVAYYPFNGNANDVSGNGNHGTVYNAVLATDRLGNANSAYFFNGTDAKIQVSDTPSLRPPTALTVAAWVNINSVPFHYLRIVTKGNNVPDNFANYQLITGTATGFNPISDKQPLFTMRTSERYGLPGPDSASTIEFGQWHHICGSWDGSYAKIYYDGQLVGSTPFGGSMSYDSNPLVIGRDLFYNQSFHGSIDEVRIYNRALSNVEVLKLYQNSSGVLPSLSLQSARQRSDGTGNVQIDYSIAVPYEGSASVNLSFSSNGGTSWDVAPQNGTLSGAFGSGVYSGARSIIWNAAAQLSANTYNNNFRARIVITTTAGSTLTTISSPFVVDIRGLQGGLAVSGRVKNANTGVALSGATVTLAGQSAVTASDGRYSFADIALSAGNTLSASKSGYATYSGTVPVPAGGVQSVPRDINLSPASGNKPVVTGVQAKYDGLFLSGASIANEYTALIDWRGQTPSKVHFYWGRNSPQHVEIATSSGQATAPINMALGFQGSLTLFDNKINVQAEDGTGQLSDIFQQNVSIIPMPLFLVDKGLLLPFTFFPGQNPSLSWEFNISAQRDIQNIPFIKSIGPDFGFDLAYDYSLVDGKWGIFAGGKWSDRGISHKGRHPLVPKMRMNTTDFNFKFGGKAEGIASQTRGVSLEKIGLELDADLRAEILAIYITDYIPGGQILRVLDALERIGIDVNSIQRITVYGTLEGSLDAMFLFPSLKFDSATSTLSPGIAAMYEPDFLGVQGEIGVGGKLTLTTELAPVFGMKQVDGAIYMKVKFVKWGKVKVDEKYLILNGTIYQRRSQGLINAVSEPVGEPLPGYDGWKVYQVRTSSSPTIKRDYLKSGDEVFVLARSDVHSKYALVTKGTNQSLLDNFRLMKQVPTETVSGVSVMSIGESNPPQLRQAELPIIVNSFPYSEPSLAGYGQELMLLWVADNANPNDLQYADIHWSRFDGVDWSVPAAIATDTRAEFAPKVSFDGNGDAVAVWQKVTNPNFTNTSLSEMAAEMEIVWSRWNRSSGTWTAPSALTANTCYDGTPLLAGPLTNGDLLVTWTRNEANLLMGTGTVAAAGSDTVLCSRWYAATHVWGEPETVVSNLAYRLSQSFAGVSNRAVYAWTADADGVLTNDTDQEVFYRFWQDGTWGAVNQLTADTQADKSVRAAVSPTVVNNQTTAASEGFEIGNFSHWPWTFEGNAAWSVQGSTVYSGSFAAASGTISHNQSSTMKAIVTCPVAGTVSFAYKVSSEGNYDYLRFYVDGQQQGAWSGSAGWSIANYPISTGQHTLQWSYTKDYSVNSGSDKAWVDLISIPGREPHGVYLVWQRAQNLVSDKDFANEPRLVRPDSGAAGFADYAMTYGPQGNMVLLWQEMTANGSDAHYSVYDPVSDTWSKDATFFNDSALERSFSPVWDSSGQLNFAYNKVEIIMTNEVVEMEGGSTVTVQNVPQQGRVDIAVAVRRLITDLAIEVGDFTADGENFLPGDAVTLAAVVRNLGDVAVSNTVVGFYDGNPRAGGTLISNVVMTGWFEGASTNTVQALWVVPEPTTNHTIYAIVNLDGLTSEFSSGNNEQTLAVGGTDLIASLVTYSAETNGAMRVYAQVRNAGAPAATNSVLAIRRCDALGTPLTDIPLATVEIPALEPGRLAHVALDLPAGTQPEGDAFYQLRAAGAGAAADVETNNNVAVFSAYLWLDTDGDGLPDNWETAHGLNARDTADAESDVDQDGLTALQEYRIGTNPGLADTDGDGMKDGAEVDAGTDPLSSDSLLRITHMGTRTSVNTQMYLPLAFQSVSNKAYVIQIAPTVTGTWMTVSEPFVSVSNRTQVLVRMLESMPQAFYRVRLSVPLSPYTFTLGFSLPDQWLGQFDWNVLPPEARSLRNAVDDPDGDGMDNQSEMAAGTDPTDSASCLRMLSFRAEGGVLSGDIQTTTGRVYYVESLMPGETSWQPVTGYIGGQNGATPWQVPRPPESQAGFFRAILGVPSEMTIITP